MGLDRLAAKEREIVTSRLSFNRTAAIMLWALLLPLAACREQAAQTLATPLPTLTPTPFSTPLPAVPTAIPPGDPGNPVRMLVVPAGPASAARGAVADAQAALQDQSGLELEIQTVERYAEALAALCESASGRVAVAWLNAPAYMAARAQSCGQPALQVQQGRGADARTGQAVEIIATRGTISTVSALTGRSFCRLNRQDFWTWLAPSLMMRASGLDPVSSLRAITDFDDLPNLIRAVAEGDCGAAGIPAGTLDELAGDLGSAVQQVRVIATSVEFPFAVLMLPPELPLDKRTALVDGLRAAAANTSTAVLLRPLLGQTALLPVTADDFADLEAFMTRTGLDFALLGN